MGIHPRPPAAGGFPPKFRDWIAALLCTSSSRILLNGVPGNPIKHGRGLRQGDTLSPLLFVIAIDTLQQLLELATRKGLLHKIRGRGIMVRTSLYADDAAVVGNPLRALFLGQQHYICGVEPMETRCVKGVKLVYHPHHVKFNDVPTLLKKSSSEAVRPGRLVTWHVID